MLFHRRLCAFPALGGGVECREQVFVQIVRQQLVLLWDVYQDVFTHSQDMLELLKAQERTGKIPAGIPDGVETANKTGELENVENDAAIVWAGEHPYIVCIMSSNLQNASEARERIVSMSKQIYEKSQG